METNFVWLKLDDRGQQATGYIEVYELIGANRAIAILHFMSQHTHVKGRLSLTLLLEGNQNNWTKGTVDRIFEDVENRIKAVEYDRFKDFEPLKQIDTQIFTIKSINGFSYLNHGDWAILG